MVKPIRLRVERLPRMNASANIHWRAKVGDRNTWAWLLKDALGWHGLGVAQPLQHAHVTFIRHSAVEPDSDNLVASFKLQRDLLMVPGKRNPAGLGLIRDDGPAHFTADYQWQRAPRNKGFIEIVVEESE